MTTKRKVFIMSIKLFIASVFGAWIGLAAPVIAGVETPATLQVQQEEPGFLNKVTTVGEKIFESGKEKFAAFRDPDAQVRALRFENEELKRRVFLAEKATADKKVMQAIDYNQAMMCLENIGSVLQNYRPSLLNPAPIPGLDTAPVTVPPLNVGVTTNE